MLTRDQWADKVSCTVAIQKPLRLIEARRLLRFQAPGASSAAFAVGYESGPQLTRDDGQLFGAPLVRDARAHQTVEKSYT